MEVRLLRMVLQCNVMEWDGDLYMQCFGTSIGTSCAPPYSGLYMEELTMKAFSLWQEMHPGSEENMSEWTRLIDDGWGLWGGSLDLLREWLKFLNSQAPTVKFTMTFTCPQDCPERGEEEHECKDFLEYLDLKMFLDREGKIQTDLFRKPDTKCQYLSPESAHPRHVFANIPRSLVHRVVRICSVPGTRELRLGELKQLLLSRGYKAGDLNKAMEYGMGLDREETLKKVVREDKNAGRVRYTITYDPKLPHLPAILGRTWRVMVETDPRLTKAFPKPPMVCLKRGKNLKEELVKARLPPRLGRPGSRASENRRVGFTSCKAGRRECSMCPFTGLAADKKSRVTQVTIQHTGKVLNLQQPITCRDGYCLYILSCTKPGCLKQYGGLSYPPIYQRFARHLGTIRDPNSDCTVARHWREPGHTLEHLEFLSVERLGTRCRTTLRQREKDMIARLGLQSAGLNINS